jgi:hypothetical protein
MLLEPMLTAVWYRLNPIPTIPNPGNDAYDDEADWKGAGIIAPPVPPACLPLPLPLPLRAAAAAAAAVEEEEEEGVVVVMTAPAAAAAVPTAAAGCGGLFCLWWWLRRRARERRREGKQTQLPTPLAAFVRSRGWVGECTSCVGP